MFWGMNLKPNRKYTQKAEKSFHISHACLDASTADDTPHKLFVNHEDAKILLCVLRKGKCEHTMLDLNFSRGDMISFESVGGGHISLSGYLIDDDYDELMNGEDDDVSDLEITQDLRQTIEKKRKNSKASNAQEEKEKDDDEEEDSEDSDFDLNAELNKQLGSDAEDDVEEEEEDDEEEDDDDEEEEDEDSDADKNEEANDSDDEEEDEEDEEEEEAQPPKAKQAKLDRSHKETNGLAKTPSEGKNKQKKEQPKQQQPEKASAEKTLAGGVKILDLAPGKGAEAKVGKKVAVYYQGRLKANNKQFDSVKQGPGFKFVVGRGAVIKGWDVGVAGMKVGGRRRITCPPNMAYGNTGAPPNIPPNSTLIFDVELKHVH